MIYLVSNQANAFNNVFTQISLDKAIDILFKLPVLGNDTETTGLSCHSKKLLTIQLGNADTQVVFDIESYSYIIPPQLVKAMNDYTGIYILQNAKFDLQFYYKQGIILRNIYDTMLAETILTLGLQKGGRDLKTITKKYCDVDLDKTVRGEIITKGLSDRVIRYAAFDVVYLPEIMEKQMKLIKRMQLQTALDLDNHFVKVLAYIEFCGIKLDWDKWKVKAQKDLEDVWRKKELLDEWLWNNGYKKYFSNYDLFTNKPQCIINWNSSKQLIPLFEEIGINCTIKVKGESKKTIEEKSLKNQIKDFPILQLYYDYSGSKKLTSTYGLSWEKVINKNTGRIHTSFKQIMNTGRLSCGDNERGLPNLQNLPNDAYTRSCFIAEKGNKISAIDYSAQESVVLANFAKDTALINFYKRGLQDMHSYVAYLLFPELQTKPQNELTNDDLKYIKKNYHDLRQTAKTAEFAIGYGGNGSTIAKNTGCSRKQGDKVYDSYFEAFAGLKNYFDLVLYKTKQRGFIEYNPVTKRKFFIHPDDPFIKYGEMAEYGNLPEDIEREYNIKEAEYQRLSQNYPIQGSSADISKLAGIYFFNNLFKRGWFGIVKIVNMVHDEYVLEAPEEMIQEVTDLMIQCMVAAGDKFCKIIPLGAEASIGDFLDTLKSDHLKEETRIKSEFYL